MLFLHERGYKCPTPVPSIFCTSRSAPSDDIAFGTDGVINDENVEGGIEIYDGEEYSEEEFFVCAVRLLNFVPGKVMTEIPLSTQMLFYVGMAVGRLDQDLKVTCMVTFAHKRP